MVKLAVLLLNAKFVAPLISAEYVPGYAMYTFEIVPKSYVFDSYFNLYVESVSAPVNVYLLYPSKVREGVMGSE